MVTTRFTKGATIARIAIGKERQEAGVRAKLRRVSMVPLGLLVVCCLSYGLLIDQLGFYWDDWPAIWVYHSLGTEGLREYFSHTRPFLGVLYGVTAGVLGEAPINWHIFALLMKWLGAVVVCWCLRGLWPNRRREVVAISFLFAVYPGFGHQPLALITSHQLLGLAVFFFSLGATVWALRLPQWFWPMNILALVGAVVSLGFKEFYVGLELLRPVFVWLVLSESITSLARRCRLVLLNWAPYIIILILFAMWRLALFTGGVGVLDQKAQFRAFAERPLREIGSRVARGLSDLVQTALLAWVETLRPSIVDLGSRSAWVAIGLTVLCTLALYYYLIQRPSSPSINARKDSPADRKWIKVALAIGTVGIVSGASAAWFANRYVVLEGLDNRFTLPSVFGASVLMVALVQYFIGTRNKQAVALALLVGLAVGFHFRNANAFHHDWQYQATLFSQLAWRAPALKPDTSILIDRRDIPVSGDYTSLGCDYSLGAPLNYIYDSRHSSTKLDYWFFNLSHGPGPTIPLKDGESLNRVLRSLTFSGSTSNSLVIWFSPPGCLRVLKPEGDELPQLPPLARAARAISHVERIDAEGDFHRPDSIFGPESKDCWCYYFEKADLARQTGDWHKVAELGDQVRHRGFKPADTTEWIPFIEGYANEGRYEDVREITRLAGTGTTIQLSLCDLWKRLDEKGNTDRARSAFISEMKSLSCVAAQNAVQRD